MSKNIKVKNPDIFFKPIDGSAPLSINWFNGPKGDAVESISENGVGFFGPSGDLLGVIFDDVCEKKDEQELLFENGTKINISILSGDIKITTSFKSKNKPA